jgi:hypothetical protein
VEKLVAIFSAHENQTPPSYEKDLAAKIIFY